MFVEWIKQLVRTNAKPIILTISFAFLFFLFVATTFANVYVPQVFNKSMDTTPDFEQVVVVDLPLFKGAPSYSWIDENGLVWWVYVGFSPQECVPPGGVPGNEFWQRVVLTNLEGSGCFDVTNMVLGDFVDECSSGARPSGFAYNAKAAVLTVYGPGDFRACHIPLRLEGPIGQNDSPSLSLSEADLRPRTTDLDTVKWAWPTDCATNDCPLQPYP